MREDLPEAERRRSLVQEFINNLVAIQRNLREGMNIIQLNEKIGFNIEHYQEYLEEYLEEQNKTGEIK